MLASGIRLGRPPARLDLPLNVVEGCHVPSFVLDSTRQSGQTCLRAGSDAGTWPFWGESSYQLTNLSSSWKK